MYWSISSSPTFSCWQNQNRKIWERKIRSAQQKSISQIIIRINQKLVLSRDARRSFDFGNDGVVRAEGGRQRHSAGEGGADDAFDHYRFACADLSTSVMDGQTPTDAGARRRTVNLPFGENAYVATVMVRVRSRTDEDHAVKKAQVFLKWVRDGASGHHRAFDRHPCLN